MNHAIIIKQHGDHNVLKLTDAPLPARQPNQATIRHTAIAFNMIDTYFRKGSYPQKLPFILGCEAAGIIEEIDDNSYGLKAGDRVVYMSFNVGSYSQRRNLEVEGLIKIPDEIDDQTAAASFLKGLTCWAFLTQATSLKHNDTVLIYAAAGATGSIMCQWANSLGANVIGVVGNDDKMDKATNNGCRFIINRKKQDIKESVLLITNNQGCQVVYDSLGAATFDTSLQCLAPLGTLVTFGNATGAVPPLDIYRLMRQGSITLIRPSVFHFVQTRNKLEQGSKELFSMLRKQQINIEVDRIFDLSDAGLAHQYVESGESQGAVILVP